MALTVSMSAMRLAAPSSVKASTARKSVAMTGAPVRAAKASSLAPSSSRSVRGAALRVFAADGDETKDAAKDDAFAAVKPTKAADFKGMSNEDLNKEIVAAKKMLFELRMRQSTRKEYKGHHFGILKTKIAQIRTVKREREVAEGVNKRDSRKMKREERAANVYL